MQITPATGPPPSPPTQTETALPPQTPQAAETPRPVLEPAHSERMLRDSRMRRQESDVKKVADGPETQRGAETAPATAGPADTKGRLIDVLA